jgi:hypothetical protein
MLKDADREDSNPQKQPEPEKISLPEPPKEPFWGIAVYSYTRAQAIEDRVLIDVSDIAGLAKDAGFRCPVAVTASVWADINNIPEGSGQDINGRLWDVLYMGNRAIFKAHDKGQTNTNMISYDIILTLPEDTIGEEPLYRLKIGIALGENGKPEMTIMRPNED